MSVLRSAEVYVEDTSRKLLYAIHFQPIWGINLSLCSVLRKTCLRVFYENDKLKKHMADLKDSIELMHKQVSGSMTQSPTMKGKTLARSASHSTLTKEISF
jgi:hypothetical protein